MGLYCFERMALRLSLRIQRQAEGSAAAFGFGLLLHHFLLLTLHLFEACHEAGLLAGLFGILGHLLSYVFFLDNFAEDERHGDGYEQRQEVIIAQRGRIVVEEYHEEHGHQIHHPFHSGHAAGLILTLGVGVDDVRNSHEQTEQRDVVAEIFGDEGYVAAPRDDGVGRREVVSPEEALSAQLYAAGEEAEHGKQDGELKQHGYATRHGAGSGFAVQGHGLLLTRHGILLARIFVVEGFDVGGQDAHLGLRDKALVRQRIEHQLDEDGEQQYHYAVVQTQTA